MVETWQPGKVRAGRGLVLAPGKPRLSGRLKAGGGVRRQRGRSRDKEVGVPASESVCAATIADRYLRLAVEVVHHGFREWRHAGSPIVNGG